MPKTPQSYNASEDIYNTMTDVCPHMLPPQHMVPQQCPSLDLQLSDPNGSSVLTPLDVDQPTQTASLDDKDTGLSTETVTQLKFPLQFMPLLERDYHCCCQALPSTFSFRQGCARCRDYAVVMLWLGYGRSGLGSYQFHSSLAILMNQVTHVQLSLVFKAPEPAQIATSQEYGKNGLSRPQASWRSWIHSVIYSTWNIINDDHVTLKLKTIVNHSSPVKREYYILKQLEGGVGIPCTFWFGRDNIKLQNILILITIIFIHYYTVFVPHCLHWLCACWILANLMVLGLLAILPYTPLYLLTSAVWLKQCQYAHQRQYANQHVCYAHIQMALHGLNSLSLQMLEIVYCNGSNASCTRSLRQNKRQTATLPAVTAIPTASAAISAAANFSTAAAILATIPTTISAAIPTTIPTVIPAAAGANATTLQNPYRQQLPIRYRTSDAAHTGPDKGEVLDLDNVSGDEEGPENLLASVIAMAPAGSNLSPLQTIYSTVRTDPLATGNLKQSKGSTNITHFYWIDSDTKSKTCIPCEILHNIDTMHKVTVYAGSTSSTAPHMRAFTYHTELYLEAAECFGWYIQIKDLNE
ncbi:hypothetical protein BDR06DRAFT_1062662 [Suillus hirtellus]|nr:hypothetical protein BDR06DRAFT_1062662 [Suillus hirtellus]